MGLSFSRNFRYVGTYVFFYYSILYDLRLVCLTNKNEIRVQSLEYDLNTTTILNILGNKTCYFVTNSCLAMHLNDILDNFGLHSAKLHRDQMAT